MGKLGSPPAIKACGMSFLVTFFQHIVYMYPQLLSSFTFAQSSGGLQEVRTGRSPSGDANGFPIVPIENELETASTSVTGVTNSLAPAGTPGNATTFIPNAFPFREAVFQYGQLIL